MFKKNIIEEVVKKVKTNLLIERKTDELSLKLSRLVVKHFKNKEDLFIEDIYFEKGNDYVLFDFICNFYEDEDLDEPFSISAAADHEEIEIAITYNPEDFPKNMSDLVAEIKETIEHELEHVEQKNFDEETFDKEEKIDHEDEDFNFKYLTSKIEVPAYVRGLIKRADTKKMTLGKTMDEWAKENQKKFKDFKKEWPKVKKMWMKYATEMKKRGLVKKFS
jgi:hypothetical protein